MWEIDYSDYPKSLISRINDVYVFSIRYFIKNTHIKFILAVCFAEITFCYCVNMVPVTSASRYITSAFRYHPR